MYPLCSNKKAFQFLYICSVSSYSFRVVLRSTDIRRFLRCYTQPTPDASLDSSTKGWDTSGKQGSTGPFSITPLALYQWESLILKQLVVEHLPHAIR